MNELDVAGILMTYSLQVKNIKNTSKLKDAIRELRKELDLRKVKCE